MSSPTDVTRLLDDVRHGRDGAVDRLLPLVYEELRRLAQAALLRERADHTLQATALAHEVYLKLVDQERAHWNDRAHFLAVAAQAVRRILIDHARSRRRLKRGAEPERVDDAELLNLPADAPPTDILALDVALTRLAREHPEKARVVEMRFFADLGAEEIAAVLGVSSRTVERHWQFARAWLFREIAGEC